MVIYQKVKLSHENIQAYSSLLYMQYEILQNIHSGNLTYPFIPQSGPHEFLMSQYFIPESLSTP